MNISDFAVPSVVAFVALVSLVQRVDLFGEFLEGAKEGLATIKEIFPSLLALVLAVGMFRASGGLDLLCGIVSPVAELVGFPSECTPLLIMRPFSGSGSVAIFESILNSCGADSYAGRVASVMLGSSETTFYTIAVYFAAAKVKKTRYTLAAAMAGDFTGWILSAAVVSAMLM
ncbi:MAG: spore maturation protein [Ruminiclostridium sp.]